MKRALVAALLVPALAHADPEARALFDDGQFGAAAARFEQLFADKASPADGINAVVAWRAAAHYAHARVLLHAIAAHPLSDDLARHAAALETRLATLTGTVTLSGADRPVIVKVDGAPAEKLGDDLVVDVGAREIVAEAENCTPFHARVTVRPTEHVPVTVALACATYPGSLHVSLHGAAKATAFVDGAVHDIAEFDLDVPIPSGRHHLTVVRQDVPIADEDIEVAAKQTTRRDVSVPWTAKDRALTGGLTTVAHGAPAGEAAAVVGVQLGAFVAFTPRFAMIPWFDIGYAANHAVGVTDAPYVGVGLIARVFGPLVQRRIGDALLAVNLDPLAFHLGLSSTGDGSSLHSVLFYSIGSASLTLELPHVHLGVVAMPIGWISKSAALTMDLGTDYGAEVSVVAGWSFQL